MYNKKVYVRRVIQIFFFSVIGFISINKTLGEAGGGIPLLSEASLHALCPFGGVVTLYNFVTLGTFIKKIHMSSVILMSLIFILSIMFGPVFCGWVCPLGSIQEWIGNIGKKIFKKKYNHFIPKKLDRYLRYLRYIVLALVVYMTSRSGYLLFSTIDPYNALFTFWSEEVALPSLVILAITLVSSLLIERPWCKYACPYGALLGLFNKIRIFKIRRNQDTCISCKRCDHVCPMNIEISNKEKVTDLQCISCYECTSQRQCPVQDTVNIKSSEKTIKMNIVGVLILVIIFGGISATMSVDIWSTTSSKIPATFTEGEYAGAYNPKDIRGSYTFKEVSDIFEIDLKVLYNAFGIDEDTDGTQIKTKDLETLFNIPNIEIGNESIQAFVALYKNLPFVLDDVYLPKQAVEILYEENQKLTEEQKTYLDAHQVELTEENIVPTSLEKTNTEISEDEQLVTGSTTFQQILDKGITQKQIENIIGKEIPSLSQIIKDYCIKEGLSFSTIKEQLNQLNK